MAINYTYIILAFAISLVFSLIGTPLIVKRCNTRGWLDQPNARKVHKHAIPRLGGTLFMPSLCIGVLITLIIMYVSGTHQIVVGLSNIIMITGAILIYMIGIFDDLKGMKATHKFIIQTIAALLFPLCNLMITNLHGLFGVYEIPVYVGYPLTVFVILLIVNAMNLIDGIDGLASSLACLILGSFAYFFYNVEAYLFSLISISLTGATLAFFFFNVYGKVGRLKTFMGDSGSLFLGYVIAYLAIKYPMVYETKMVCHQEAAILASFTLVFLPCIDVIRVALQRKLNRKNMFDADKTHIHHMIMDIGIGMYPTLGVIICLFCCLCVINWALYTSNISLLYISLADVVIYALFIGCVKFLKKER